MQNNHKCVILMPSLVNKSNMKSYIYALKFLFPTIFIDIGSKVCKFCINTKRALSNYFEEYAIIIDNNSKNDKSIFGNNAKKIIGRTSDKLKIMYPFKNGTIYDFESAKKFFSYIYKREFRDSIINLRFLKPIPIVSIPHNTSEVELNALEDSFVLSGFKNPIFIEQSSALFYGVYQNYPKQTIMIIDWGSHLYKIYLLNEGNLIKFNEIKLGSDELDFAIQKYMQNKYNLIITLENAEILKKEMLDLNNSNKETFYSIVGRDYTTFLPRTIKISSIELQEATENIISKITQHLSNFLETITPEIFFDLHKNGIYLSGGGSKIKGIDKYFSKAFKLNFIKLENDMTIIKGLINIYKDYSLLKTYSIQDFILR